MTLNCEQTGLERFQDDSELGTAGPSNGPAQPGRSNRDGTKGTSKDESGSDPSKPGVIYARVSSNEQAEEGRSIEAQIDEMRDKAEEFNVELVCEPITDEGETGTNFDRAGIKQVFQLAANDEISYILVDDVSRIGRNAPETLYYIHVLRKECGVKIITLTGLRNISRVQDLLETAMQTLIAHMSSQYRTRSSLRSRIRGFAEERNWFSWYNQVPLGYTATEDNWLTPDPEEAEVVRQMFEHFLDTESYTATARLLNQEFEDVLEEPLTYRQVKRDLQRRVYKGEPTIDPDVDHEDSRTVEDSQLLLVDPETFDEAQSVIDDISTENSSDGTTLDKETVINEFGPIPVMSVISIVKLLCEECSGEFRLNGQRDLNGEYSGHNLECKKCGRQRKFPYQRELDELERF